MGVAKVTRTVSVLWALPVASVTADRGMVTRTPVQLSSTQISSQKPATLVNAHVDQDPCRELTLGERGLRWFISKSDFPICCEDADLSDRLCLVLPIRRDYEWETCQLKFGYCEI